MKKQTSLHITAPCHEDWNGMQPSAEGRFCHQCSKQVTDFTTMSDRQILAFLSSHRGGLCGRFVGSQLNRLLAEAPVPVKRRWYIALSLPLLLLFQKGTAQVKSRAAGTTVVRNERTVMGDTILPIPIKAPVPADITLYGTVTDERGTPIQSASIVQKGTGHGTVSDSAGRFSLQLPVNDSGVTVEVSYIGYVQVEERIATGRAPAPLEVSLQLQPAFPGEVVVAGGYLVKRSRKAISTFAAPQKISRMEKADSALQKITRSRLFTVYPNPEAAGSEVAIRIKKEGSYEVQLLGNDSRLLQSEQFSAAGDGAVASLRVPSGTAAGVYYLRIINTRNEKSYLEKLVVR